jgi:outer membrane lipoprotein-sorting protein
MSKLIEQLEHLQRAVPDAPGFADSVACAIRDMRPPAIRDARRIPGRRWLAVAAMAVLIAGGVIFMFAFSAFALSPQQAFGQMLKRVEQLDSVRYCVVSEKKGGDPSAHASTDRRTVAAGGLRRSELMTPGYPLGVFVHNQQTSPDCDLWIYPDEKRAEFELVDKERESLADGNPVNSLKEFMMAGVKAAPDETYQGKAARVFVSAEPESIDGGLQTRTRRVLVDKSAGLPLRIEIETKVTGQGTFHMVMDQFDWHPTIDDSTFSTKVPDGFATTYDLIKPLSHALYFYNGLFGQLPQTCDADALQAYAKKLQEQSATDKKPLPEGDLYDVEWGFAARNFAARHRMDFRYYGAGKRLGVVAGKSPEQIAAIETAPGSGKYDVLMSDFSRGRVDRSQLP